MSAQTQPDLSSTNMNTATQKIPNKATGFGFRALASAYFGLKMEGLREYFDSKIGARKRGRRFGVFRVVWA
jgi:hypothetical protein